MSYAVLELDFYRLAITGQEYLLRTTVNPYESTPDEIRKCLVITKGDEVSEERISRVATFSEIGDGTPLPELPLAVEIFSSALYTTPFSNGDSIAIASPDKWVQLYNTPATFYCEVVDDSNPDYPVVTPSAAMQLQGFTYLPAFGRKLSFSVNGGSVFTDGLANRDYTGLPGVVFRAETHGDTWENLADATALYDSLPGEAQSLVDAYNEDRWSGDSTQRYE